MKALALSLALIASSAFAQEGALLMTARTTPLTAAENARIQTIMARGAHVRSVTPVVFDANAIYSRVIRVVIDNKEYKFVGTPKEPEQLIEATIDLRPEPGRQASSPGAPIPRMTQRTVMGPRSWVGTTADGTGRANLVLMTPPSGLYGSLTVGAKHYGVESHGALGVLIVADQHPYSPPAPQPAPRAASGAKR